MSALAKKSAIVRAVKIPTVVTIGERENPPRGWHEQANGELVCPHRDLSVCPECAKANPEANDCAGRHFWIPVSLQNLSPEALDAFLAGGAP